MDATQAVENFLRGQRQTLILHGIEPTFLVLAGSRPIITTKLSPVEDQLIEANELLSAVSHSFTRDDALPDNLLTRIDSFLERT